MSAHLEGVETIIVGASLTLPTVNLSSANASKKSNGISGQDSEGSSEHYECKICGKQFNGIYKYKLHERYHERAGSFKCQYCTKAFISRGHVIRHERTHTGEKPFACPTCGKKFGQAAHCRLHQRTHKRP